MPAIWKTVLAVAFAAPALAAPPLAVPLVLEESAGVARHTWPATASVPMPRGRVPSADALWLATADGRAAPAQLRALERWPDGSVRWLLVDFLAEAPSGGRATYTLRDGKPPAPPRGPRLRIESAKDGGRRLDTGVLAATVPAHGAAFLEDVAVGGRHVRTVALPPLTVDGAPAGVPTRDRVSVETEGPIRTELLLTGRYPQGVAWELRVAAFAGQRLLRLRHTVTNVADRHYAPVRSLALAVPGRYNRASVGIDGGERPVAPLDAAHELVHLDATPVELDGARAGRHADGWAHVSGDGVAVTLVGIDFWEEYPKAIRVAPDRLAIDLFAGAAAPVQFGSGAAKTHEVWLVVEPDDRATPPADLAAALAAPLVALPPASWIVASRALPQALDPDAPGARDFLARLARAYAGYRAKARIEPWDDGPPVPCDQRPTENRRVGLYGVFNWGDWQFPGYRDHVRGCDGWGNLEYDLPQVLGLGWAATGSRAFYAGLLAAGRHYRDVDIIHHAPGHPDWVGLNHPHKALHFAWEAPEKIDLGHTWTEGLVTAWRFTGERRFLDAARGIADALTGRVAQAKNPRQFGWPMLALVAVHDATGERRYLDAARAYADAGTRAFRPTPAAGDWKMGILADGVAAVHGATGDDGLARWLVSYADTLLAAPGKWKDPRFALPLGYLAALKDDGRYEAAALDVVRGMQIGEWGKALAWTGRTGFRLLAPLATRTGLRPSRPSTSPPSDARPGRAAPRRESPPAPRPRSPSRRAPAPLSDD